MVGVCAEGTLLDQVRAEGFRDRCRCLRASAVATGASRAFRDLVRLLRAERPDLVHAHMPISGFLARLAARLAGVPRVAYTCHGFLFNQHGSLPRRAGGFAMEWIGGRITDVFMTVSASEAADARRLRIFRDAVAVGNGRDPAVFRPDGAARARIRAALGMPADRVVVVAVSRLVRAQGLSGIGRGDARRCRRRSCGWWASGWLRIAARTWRRCLREAGLGDRLRLLGYREDVAAVLAAADIFVLPSYFEALPMSVIEAMLVGLPVVASDVGGPREQVVPDVTGLLVPPRAGRAAGRGAGAAGGGCRRCVRAMGAGGPRTGDRRLRRDAGRGADAGPAWVVASTQHVSRAIREADHDRHRSRFAAR